MAAAVRNWNRRQCGHLEKPVGLRLTRAVHRRKAYDSDVEPQLLAPQALLLDSRFCDGIHRPGVANCASVDPRRETSDVSATNHDHTPRARSLARIENS